MGSAFKSLENVQVLSAPMFIVYLCYFKMRYITMIMLFDFKLEWNNNRPSSLKEKYN